MFNRKILSLILSALILLSVASCSDAPTDSESDSAQSTDQVIVQADQTETERQYVDDITDDVKFDGTTVNILWQDDTFATEYSGQLANDAQYDRELSVENRLGINIENIDGDFHWDTRNDYLASVINSYMANDDAFNIVECGIAPYLIIEGVLFDLNMLNYIDLDKPYWANNMVEELSINGKLYSASGDISPEYVTSIYCVWYNDVIRQSLNLEDPTVLVDEGRWTRDAFQTMSANVYLDLDGNGKLSLDDQFGLVIREANALTPFIAAFDLKIAEIDSDNHHVLTFNNEKSVSAFEYMTGLLNNLKNVVFGGEGGTKYDTTFNEGRSLFVVGKFSDSVEFVEMEDEIGILPLPKWDENQASYQTIGSDHLFGITASTNEVNAAAAAMELMASEGYRILTPALYETNLKTRYSTDPEMARMFDVVRSGVTVDFGLTYGWYFEGISAFWKIQVADRGDWASSWKKVEGLAQDSIDEFYDVVGMID